MLFKVNQAGTVTEALAAASAANRLGYTLVASVRSGETEDATMSDLAVATCAGQFKVGSVTQSDRLAKYNQLLRIEEMLGDTALYHGSTVIRK